MPVNHTCSSGCFSKRTASKYIINCRLCDHRCNLQCFSLPPNIASSDFPKELNVSFVCTKCYQILFKNNGHRSSLNKSNVSAKLAAPSVDGDGNSTKNSNKNRISNSNSSQSLENSALLKLVNDRLNLLEINLDQKISKINEGIAQNYEKLNNNLYNLDMKFKQSDNDTFNYGIDKIMNELLKISHASTKSVTIDQLKESIANICSCIDKRLQQQNKMKHPHNHNTIHHHL